MALTDGQKQLTALLAMKNPDADYIIRLANDSLFAFSELLREVPKLKEELQKEKDSHESHIATLNTRLEKISLLLSGIEEILNYGNE